MKLQLIFSAGLFLWSLLINGQSIDNQWLVLDNNGKSGYNTGTEQNIYNNGNIGHKIKLCGIEHVVVTDPQVARNDIFVIYEDGNYFNSRDYNAENYNPYFFLPNEGNQDSTNHYFESLYESDIQYLYLTNRYETDDPPRNVRLKNWSGYISTDVETFSNSIPAQLMTANHTVSIDKDITLILKNSGDIEVNDTLYTGRIIDGSNNIIEDVFYEVSNVFSSGQTYSNIDVEDDGKGKIVLKGFSANDPPYIFINLRPTSSLVPYASDAKSIFYLKHASESIPYTVLEESIDFSHDPNFIQVLSTCQKSEEEKYVTYHIEFENTGSIPADKVKISFTLPDYFYEKCITDVTFYVGGIPVEGTVGRFERNVEFVFDPDDVILPCVPGNQIACSGYVEFSIRINESVDLTDLGTSLAFEDPKVIFNHTAFPIDLFEDLEWVADLDNPDGNSRRSAPLSSCSCECDLTGLTSINNPTDIIDIEIELFPNPGNFGVNISWYSSQSETLEIKLMNVMGREFKKQFFQAQKGENNMLLDVNDLMPGVYLVNIKSGLHSRSSIWMKADK